MIGSLKRPWPDHQSTLSLGLPRNGFLAGPRSSQDALGPPPRSPYSSKTVWWDPFFLFACKLAGGVANFRGIFLLHCLWGQKDDWKNQDGGGGTYFWQWPPAASGEGFPLFHCFNLLVWVVRNYDHLIIWRDLGIISWIWDSSLSPSLQGCQCASSTRTLSWPLCFEGRFAMPRRDVCWSWRANPGTVLPSLMCLSYVLVSTLAVYLCVCWSIISVCVCGPTMVGAWTRSFW